MRATLLFKAVAPSCPLSTIRRITVITSGLNDLPAVVTMLANRAS